MPYTFHMMSMHLCTMFPGITRSFKSFNQVSISPVYDINPIPNLSPLWGNFKSD